MTTQIFDVMTMGPEMTDIVAMPVENGLFKDTLVDDTGMDSLMQCRALSTASLCGMPKQEADGLLEMLKTAKKHGVKTFANIFVQKGDARLGVKRFLPYIDFFILNEMENVYVTNGLGIEEAKAGTANVSMQPGAHGECADCKDYTGYIPANNIKTPDTTGSGDAICVDLIQSALGGMFSKDTIDYAYARYAFNASTMGAYRAPLTTQTVKTFIAGTACRSGS